MPAVYPFNAVQYTTGRDLSSVVAPPYDVLDAAGKQRLLEKDPRNIVAIDLPHTPAKELGPPAAYEQAASAFQALMTRDVLKRSQQPVMFAYRQTFQSGGATPRQVQRSGMACCVDAAPFGPRAGGGILPHEETFSGPKEDRLALMRATRTQLSPIFGLHADERGAARDLLAGVMKASTPDHTARTDDGTLHELWTISDEPTVRGYQQALAGEDVFIADGHHRYTTQLNYIRDLEAKGTVAAGHPARRNMMVLVGMSDPGLVIWPTHRVLGGMADYTLEKFAAAAQGSLLITPTRSGLDRIEQEMSVVTLPPPPLANNVFGLYDFASKRCFLATLTRPDPLKDRFAEKPAAWRGLDVAIIQYLIVEQVCQPRLNAGNPVKWAFPHTIREVEQIGQGAETGAGGGAGFTPQLAVIVRPTPLDAVKEVSRANQLMPQKSTFFYPKLATGLFINPLA